MDHRTFFAYYLPALAEALRHDHEWEVFSVKGPEFFYVGDEQLYQALETFIEAHCDEIPLFDRVGLYFDCLSHGFDAIDGVKTKDYKAMLQQEAASLKQKFEVE
ncbi:hypothetical protein [Hymenobacter canadensis]|uniref:Uncharacterized protein n=1 Tax=Hymenobacter canadensis TaxID=2999067 RepID=A0ABY7LUY6_9BACT|nr:hypothetical protein [Hymenobacter canadensis]WBA44203.1 hypothetical protein O3303_20155 [Hymenobacter canadensis]